MAGVLSGLLFVSWSSYLPSSNPVCVLMFSLFRLLSCQGGYSSVIPHVCPSARPSTCLSVIYLFIFCLICLPGLQCRLEACLPSFTVKCSADWKGHFSNGAALPLIFCLSLGVRLIYHASSPADIQIHFDWRLDRMTPAATNTAIITVALAHTCTNTYSGIWLPAYSRAGIQWI